MFNEVNNENIYKLNTCVWEITLACCFSCEYCGSKAGKARENELTTEECLDVVNQLSSLGCRRVSLIGGEVFMRKDWKPIIRALVNENILVSVITNGYMLNETIISKLKELSVESVAISLDGPEEIHDKYRQPGSFTKAIDSIKLLSESDIPVSIISTIHSENIDFLDSLYETLVKTDIFAWQLQACSPMGNVVDGMVSSKFDVKKVLDFVKKHYKKAPFRLGIADNIGYYTRNKGEVRVNSGSAFFGGCAAGLSNIGIDSVGNVKGCESLYNESFIEGNLREKSLSEIWNDPNAFAYNRKFTKELLTGNCAKCKHGRICAGGCRSYNYFSSGKLYESAICIK